MRLSVVARGPEAAARVSTSSVAYNPTIHLFVLFPQPSLQSQLLARFLSALCEVRERVVPGERDSVVAVSVRGPQRAMLDGALRERCTHKVVGCFRCLLRQERILLQAIGTRVLLHCTPEVVHWGVTASPSCVLCCHGRGWGGKGVGELFVARHKAFWPFACRDMRALLLPLYRGLLVVGSVILRDVHFLAGEGVQ